MLNMSALGFTVPGGTLPLPETPCALRAGTCRGLVWQAAGRRQATREPARWPCTRGLTQRLENTLRRFETQFPERSRRSCSRNPDSVCIRSGHRVAGGALRAAPGRLAPPEHLLDPGPRLGWHRGRAGPPALGQCWPGLARGPLLVRGEV